LAQTVNDAGTNVSGKTLGQDARQVVGFEAIFRRLDALEGAGWERRLSSLEALNVERRIAQLEAEEILRRERSLQFTRQEEENESAYNAALNALTDRVAKLDLAMVGIRSAVWHGLDYEGTAMRDRLGRDRSRESGFFGVGGSRGKPWSSTAVSSSSMVFPPTDRRLRMMTEEAPPIWDINKETSAVVPLPSTRSWNGLPSVGQPSRENTCVSDTCLSKELRENSESMFSNNRNSTWRSALQIKVDM